MMRISICVLVGLLVAPGSARAWSHVVILAGEFQSARSQLEAVRETESSPETVVLHDGPDRGDSVAYRPHYCPSAHRSEERCTEGGAVPIPLSDIHPEWQDEVDLGDPDTLVHLLTWARAAEPAGPLLVTFKGRSRFGHLVRDDDAGDQAGLTADELSDALAAAGVVVDVLALATSASASVEVAAALAERVRLLVATQESTSNGRSVYFRLSKWQALLRDQPDLSPRELARQVAFNYRDPSYTSFDPELEYAVSVVDLSLAGEIATRWTDDCARLLELGDAGIDELDAVASDVWRYGASGTRADLGGLLDRLAAIDDGGDQPLGLRTRLALRSATVESFAAPEGGATGLSIFFPADVEDQWDLREAYRRRFGSFAADTGWKRLLEARLRLARERVAGCGATHPAPWLLALAFVLLARRTRVT